MVALAAGINILLLSGCSKEEPMVSMNPVTGDTGMEQTPIVDYELPRMRPNVLVDHHGYQISSDKVAVVKGAALPRGFELLDAQSHRVVFTGILTEVQHLQEEDCYIAYADFSDFNENGKYYLRCDIVGESDRFPVDSQIYKDSFHRVLSETEQACKDGNISLEAINRMLIAYEWYPGLFEDMNGDTVPDTLKVIADWIEKHVQELSAENDFSAAVLAKFSYLYQDFDRKYANQCLQMASNLYEQSTGSKGADSFYALTELYRASGLAEYKKQISGQTVFFESSNSYLEQMGYLYGSMTYMGTRQQIDVDLCNVLMTNIMDRAEETAALHSDTLHPLSPRNNGEQEVLKKSFELACANYVTNNYQYNHVQEDFAHYLMGRNRDSLCMYEKLEDKSSCLVLLAQLANIYN